MSINFENAPKWFLVMLWFTIILPLGVLIFSFAVLTWEYSVHIENSREVEIQLGIAKIKSTTAKLACRAGLLKAEANKLYFYDDNYIANKNDEDKNHALSQSLDMERGAVQSQPAEDSNNAKKYFSSDRMLLFQIQEDIDNLLNELHAINKELDKINEEIR